LSRLPKDFIALLSVVVGGGDWADGEEESISVGMVGMVGKGQLARVVLDPAGLAGLGLEKSDFLLGSSKLAAVSGGWRELVRGLAAFQNRQVGHVVRAD
jgi:hypothetical protein